MEHSCSLNERKMCPITQSVVAAKEVNVVLLKLTSCDCLYDFSLLESLKTMQNESSHCLYRLTDNPGNACVVQ